MTLSLLPGYGALFVTRVLYPPRDRGSIVSLLPGCDTLFVARVLYSLLPRYDALFVTRVYSLLPGYALSGVLYFLC